MLQVHRQQEETRRLQEEVEKARREQQEASQKLIEASQKTIDHQQKTHDRLLTREYDGNDSDTDIGRDTSNGHTTANSTYTSTATHYHQTTTAAYNGQQQHARGDIGIYLHRFHLITNSKFEFPENWWFPRNLRSVLKSEI